MPTDARMGSPARPRLAGIDAARGAAVVAMVLYHLCWDLDHFGWLRLDLFTAPAWLAARAAILSSFLFLAGVSLVLTARAGFDARRFRRRWLVLAVAAAAITMVSLAVFPASPILFGVLHHLAVGSLLGLGFLRLPAAATLVAGAVVLALPGWAALPLFDPPWLSWIGMAAHDPDANDYVPLVPWFGVMLVGIALGKLWDAKGWARPQGGGWSAAPLVWLGRHSLAVYLIHQPVLFAALWGLTAAGLSPINGEERAFHASCVESCVGNGAEASVCAQSCSCIAGSLKQRGLWRGVLEQRLDPDTMTEVTAVIRSCRP